jgi:hypothetical protein
LLSSRTALKANKKIPPSCPSKPAYRYPYNAPWLLKDKSAQFISADHSACNIITVEVKQMVGKPTAVTTSSPFKNIYDLAAPTILDAAITDASSLPSLDDKALSNKFLVHAHTLPKNDDHVALLSIEQNTNKVVIHSNVCLVDEGALNYCLHPLCGEDNIKIVKSGQHSVFWEKIIKRIESYHHQLCGGDTIQIVKSCHYNMNIKVIPFISHFDKVDPTNSECHPTLFLV